MTTNLPASVRQRLRNVARDLDVDYNRLQLLYLQERWLARLAHTRHRDHLVLKGGLFLYGNYGLPSRPTRDIDFLGRATQAGITHVVQMMRDIADIGLPDGIRFDATSVTGEENRAATEYGGIRVELMGYLGTARERIRIDVGFGDALPNGPVPLEFPTLLGEAPLVLLAYSFETVIAEKLQAATVLYEVNSRLKDFYDIRQLAASEVFDATSLHHAIGATFARRGTSVPAAIRLFSPEFTDDGSRQTQWSAFLRRVGQHSPERFSSVMVDIQTFLEPILVGTATGVWRPAEWRWAENEHSGSS